MLEHVQSRRAATVVWSIFWDNHYWILPRGPPSVSDVFTQRDNIFLEVG